MNKILLTGGAGFIGSHTAVTLIEAGYDIVIADNLINSDISVINKIEKITGKNVIFNYVDFNDRTQIYLLFKEFHFDTVIHFAGYKAVNESIKTPLSYYKNNLISTLNLLSMMQEFLVHKLIFSSSATIYRADNPIPYKEGYHLGSTNPYGKTKLMIEQILEDICEADSAMSVCCLRYFNPIGAHSSGLLGENPKGIPNNLVPYIAKVAIGELPYVQIFGDDYLTPDGTGIRDYIHIMDLAQGHLLALEYLKNKTGIYPINLGTGKGYSVKEVISTYSEVCGQNIPFQIESRRAGDLAEVYADIEFAKKELGFEAKYDLRQMCEDSWRFVANQNEVI
jgi:UDP-glucose 4-epimerase